MSYQLWKWPQCCSSRSSVSKVCSSRSTRVREADVAEVVGRQRREQEQPHVGRRGAVGDLAVGDPPGSCRAAASGRRRRRRSRRRARSSGRPCGGSRRSASVRGTRPPARLADPEGDSGRERATRPGQGAAATSAAGSDQATSTARPRASAGAGHMLSDEGTPGRCPAAVRSSRGLPFEQVPARDEEPDQRAARWRRPRAAPGRPGNATESMTWPAVGGSAVAPPLQPPATAPHRADERCRHDALQAAAAPGRPARRRRPEPGRAGQDRPAQDEHHHQRRGHQAAPEVVEELPALQERQRVAPRARRPSGTQRPSQGRSCQSPRTQRCSRRA